MSHFSSWGGTALACLRSPLLHLVVWAAWAATRWGAQMAAGGFLCLVFVSPVLLDVCLFCFALLVFCLFGISVLLVFLLDCLLLG